ncbi:DUF6788 family protein [Novosphingobium sp.]|uniref:DUF6788 family protein n=1 Tax=Novosphingobium sp. TaxID=1874826 RepID=UPI003D6CD718
MAKPPSADREAQTAIASRLAEVGFALPGTLLERRMSCGKPGCRCKADPPRLHGPYHQWTRTIDGKTVTRRLTDEQAVVYGPWFANARRLRALVNELEALSLRIFERAEG